MKNFSLFTKRPIETGFFKKLTGPFSTIRNICSDRSSDKSNNNSMSAVISSDSSNNNNNSISDNISDGNNRVTVERLSENNNNYISPLDRWYSTDIKDEPWSPFRIITRENQTPQVSISQEDNNPQISSQQEEEEEENNSQVSSSKNDNKQSPQISSSQDDDNDDGDNNQSPPFSSSSSPSSGGPDTNPPLGNSREDVSNYSNYFFIDNLFLIFLHISNFVYQFFDILSEIISHM